jgi:hypothetical protein
VDSPDWYAPLRARVEGLQEPLKTFGVQQCEEALATSWLFPTDTWVIAFELAEVIESLEFSDSQILAMPHGRRQALLAQANWWLYV